MLTDPLHNKQFADAPEIPDKVGSYEFPKKKKLRPGTAVYRSESFYKKITDNSAQGHVNSVRTIDLMSRGIEKVKEDHLLNIVISGPSS